MNNISLNDEVYAVIGYASCRGNVVYKDSNRIEVCFESGNVLSYDIADIGENVFTTEKALVKKLGSKVRELAAPKVVSVDETNDFYHLPVKVGDYVVAIAGNPLYCRVEGKIEKLYKEYSEYHPETIYADLRKKVDQTFTRVEVCNLVLQSRFAER